MIYFKENKIVFLIHSSVVSPNCDATNCRIVIGTTLQGTVTFTPTAAHSHIEAFLEVFIDGSWRDFPVTEPNACLSMTPGCPTTPNVPQNWAINIPINPNYTPVASTSWECEYKFFYKNLQGLK